MGINAHVSGHKRLRYYVSHRLIAKSGEANHGGWRLPAPELEEQIVVLIHKALSTPGAVSHLVPNLSADAIGRIRSALSDGLQEAKPANTLKLVETITVTPGQLKLRLMAAGRHLLRARGTNFTEGQSRLSM